jgi:hypothetical protein
MEIKWGAIMTFRLNKTAKSNFQIYSRNPPILKLKMVAVDENSKRYSR